MLKDLLTLILCLSIDLFCTAHGCGAGLTFSELSASRSLNEGLGNGSGAHSLWAPLKSVPGGYRGTMFSSCFSLTPREATLSLVGGGANEFSRILFFSLQS